MAPATAMQPRVPGGSPQHIRQVLPVLHELNSAGPMCQGDASSPPSPLQSVQTPSKPSRPASSSPGGQVMRGAARAQAQPPGGGLGKARGWEQAPGIAQTGTRHRVTPPPPPPPVPDACALQPAPDALPEEEEPVLLKRGLRDIKKRPEQLDHVRAHQPAQELGQNGLSQTVLGGLDMASVWEEKGGCSTRAPPASSPEGPGQVWAACGVSGRRSRGGGGYLGNGASPRGV